MKPIKEETIVMTNSSTVKSAEETTGGVSKKLKTASERALEKEMEFIEKMELIGPRIIVLVSKVQERKTESGFYIPQTTTDWTESKSGIVLRAGQTKSIQEGDRVLLAETAGIYIDLPELSAFDNPYLLCSEEHVLAKLPSEDSQ